MIHRPSVFDERRRGSRDNPDYFVLQCIIVDRGPDVGLYTQAPHLSRTHREMLAGRAALAYTIVPDIVCSVSDDRWAELMLLVIADCAREITL